MWIEGYEKRKSREEVDESVDGKREKRRRKSVLQKRATSCQAPADYGAHG